MFIEDAPEIEFRDDLAHVSYRIGGSVFEFVMRPRTFMGALCSAEELAAKWRVDRLDCPEVARLPGRKKRR